MLTALQLQCLVCEGSEWSDKGLVPWVCGQLGPGGQLQWHRGKVERVRLLLPP